MFHFLLILNLIAESLRLTCFFLLYSLVLLAVCMKISCYLWNPVTKLEHVSVYTVLYSFHRILLTIYMIKISSLFHSKIFPIISVDIFYCSLCWTLDCKNSSYTYDVIYSYCLFCLPNCFNNNPFFPSPFKIIILWLSVIVI